MADQGSPVDFCNTFPAHPRICPLILSTRIFRGPKGRKMEHYSVKRLLMAVLVREVEINGCFTQFCNASPVRAHVGG